MAVVRHAAYCATRNLYDDMETAAKSLVANSSVDAVHFIIEDDAFPRELPPIVRCHDVGGQGIFPLDGPNARTGWTWMVLMKAALHRVLPDVGRVLLLDCDTTCAADMDAIWDTDLDGLYFAGVPEWHKGGGGLDYCNFGVVYANLDQLRDGKGDEIVAALNARRYSCCEQDASNYLCTPRVATLDGCWNSCWWTDKNAPGARIIHFAGVDDATWHARPDVTRWRETPWDEVMRLHEEHANR